MESASPYPLFEDLLAVLVLDGATVGSLLEETAQLPKAVFELILLARDVVAYVFGGPRRVCDRSLHGRDHASVVATEVVSEL